MKKIIQGAAVLFFGLIFSASAFAAPREVIPGGNAVGLQFHTQGVSIVELTDAVPKEAGLKKGDMIVQVDDTAISTTADLKKCIENSSGKTLTVHILRENKQKEYVLAPKMSPNGWQLGLLVKDSICGIGTVTYYDSSNGSFGALGHGVGTQNALLPLREGEVLPAAIHSVIRGQEGKPGALQGEPLSRESCGQILRNTPQGIFGIGMADRGTPIPVASAGEIRTGEAMILSNVTGTQVEEFTVQIREIRPGDNKDRNFVLEVTDPRLLNTTGGIVQGMSGSPIIQDGKLIGAVTHVLVDDPTTGYGIFIENMLDAAA